MFHELIHALSAHEILKAIKINARDDNLGVKIFEQSTIMSMHLALDGLTFCLFFSHFLRSSRSSLLCLISYLFPSVARVIP
jgi:hypothetical protein